MIPIRACFCLLFSLIAGVCATAQDTLFLKSGRAQITDMLPSGTSDWLYYKSIRKGKVVKDSIYRNEVLVVHENQTAFYPGLGAEVDRKKYSSLIGQGLRKEKSQYQCWNPLYKTYRLKTSRSRAPKGNAPGEVTQPEIIPPHLTYLVLIDRKPRKGIYIDTLERVLYYREPGTLNIREIEQDKVFAVRSITGSERMVYLQDTLENNWLSAIEMHDYIEGQYDAMRFYRIRPTLAASLGLLVGGAGSNLGMFYGPLTVIAYTGIVGFTLPGTGKSSGYNQMMLENEAYREGFSTAAKRKAARRSALFSGIGYIGGLTVLTLILP